MSATPGQGPPRTVTASVLFVDVVDSTALRARLGEEDADALARDLEARIGVAVREHSGRVVKGLVARREREAKVCRGGLR